jgi:hypothetical protein
MRDGNLCNKIVVLPLWGHLKAAVVRVKVIVVVIKVVVNGQVLFRKVLSRSIGSEVMGNTLIEYPAHFLVNKAVDLLVVQILQG